MDFGQLVKRIQDHGDMSADALHGLILDLGLNDEILHEQPAELSPYFGKGLKMWQYPNQLSKFASKIAELKVESYLEIGCRHGGTFVFNSEILAKKNPHIGLYACDIIPMGPVLEEYSKHRTFKYINMPSTSDEFRDMFRKDPPEFVFIDGDHNYEGVKNDFEIFKDTQKTKYVVFHDIDSDVCPGVKHIWEEVKRDPRFETEEFCDQYESVRGSFLGIGLATRKQA